MGDDKWLPAAGGAMAAHTLSCYYLCPHTHTHSLAPLSSLALARSRQYLPPVSLNPGAPVLLRTHPEIDAALFLFIHSLKPWFVSHRKGTVFCENRKTIENVLMNGSRCDSIGRQLRVHWV